MSTSRAGCGGKEEKAPCLNCQWHEPRFAMRPGQVKRHISELSLALETSLTSGENASMKCLSLWAETDVDPAHGLRASTRMFVSSAQLLV